MSVTMWVNPVANVYKLYLDGIEKTFVSYHRINYKSIIEAYKNAGYKKAYISYVGKMNGGFN